MTSAPPDPDLPHRTEQALRDLLTACVHWGAAGQAVPTHVWAAITDAEETVNALTAAQLRRDILKDWTHA